MVKTVLSMLLFCTVVFSQNTLEAPYPEITLDSLAAKLNYPEIWNRAGVNSLYIFKIKIDTSGSIIDFQIKQSVNFYNDSLHVDYFNRNMMNDNIIADIEKTIRSVKWFPAKLNGKPYEFTMDLPVYFDIYSQHRQKTLIRHIPYNPPHMDY